MLCRAVYKTACMSCCAALSLLVVSYTYNQATVRCLGWARHIAYLELTRVVLLQVAIALSLLVAEVTAPPFSETVCTFSAQPQLHTVKGETLVQKVLTSIPLHISCYVGVYCMKKPCDEDLWSLCPFISASQSACRFPDLSACTTIFICRFNPVVTMHV